MKIIKTKTSITQQFFRILLICFAVSLHAYAELEELDDKKLKEQTGKEGITIDLSYKLSIGEIAFDFSNRELNVDNRTKTLTPPPPRIEYVQGKN